MEFPHGLPAEATVPMGWKYVKTLSALGDHAVDQSNAWLRDNPTVLQRVEILGDLASLLGRAAGCYWGCSHEQFQTNHEMESLAAANTSAANSAILLMSTGYYDEALARVRSISERVNLYALFFAKDKALCDWLLMTQEQRQNKFKPVAVRIRLEQLNQPIPYDERTYRSLSSRGVHASTTAQHFTLGRTNGYHFGKFQPLGLHVCVDELARAMLPATRDGIAILDHIDPGVREDIDRHVWALSNRFTEFKDLQLLTNLDESYRCRSE